MSGTRKFAFLLKWTATLVTTISSYRVSIPPMSSSLSPLKPFVPFQSLRVSSFCIWHLLGGRIEKFSCSRYTRPEGENVIGWRSGNQLLGFKNRSSTVRLFSRERHSVGMIRIIESFNPASESSPASSIILRWLCFVLRSTRSFGGERKLCNLVDSRSQPRRQVTVLVIKL